MTSPWQKTPALLCISVHIAYRLLAVGHHLPIHGSPSLGQADNARFSKKQRPPGCMHLLHCHPLAKNQHATWSNMQVMMSEQHGEVMKCISHWNVMCFLAAPRPSAAKDHVSIYIDHGHGMAPWLQGGHLDEVGQSDPRTAKPLTQEVTGRPFWWSTERNWGQQWWTAMPRFCFFQCCSWRWLT